MGWPFFFILFLPCVTFRSMRTTLDRKSFCGTIGAPPMRSFGRKPRFPRMPPSALRGVEGFENIYLFPALHLAACGQPLQPDAQPPLRAELVTMPQEQPPLLRWTRRAKNTATAMMARMIISAMFIYEPLSLMIRMANFCLVIPSQAEGSHTREKQISGHLVSLSLL